jgi:uncharacterized protein YdaU (DUF1376 family)
VSSKPAAIPLFADAYLADTMHLTTEEHGAYLLMLMAAWRYDDCSLPNDDKKLARIVGLSTRRWTQIRETILDFWTLDQGRIWNARLRKERGYVLQKSESNRENARKRWEAQTTENKRSASSDRICERNAPPPPPIEEEPNGSPSERDAHARAEPRKMGSRGSRLPDGWRPDLTERSRAIVERWPEGMLDHEIAKFRDHAADKGRTSKDWQAAFRKWVDNADQWRNRDADRGSPGRVNPAGNSRNRDSRDGFQRSIDRRLDELEPAQPARPARRRDAGDGGASGELPLTQVVQLR